MPYIGMERSSRPTKNEVKWRLATVTMPPRVARSSSKYISSR